MHVAILCEFGSINGGENSLLAVLDHCPEDIRLTVLAPATGRLADALALRQLTHVPFSLHDDVGLRLPPMEAASLLAPVIDSVRPDLLHGNSLSTGRITGLLSQQTGLTCTAHLRDIIGLSKTAISHLNGNRKLIAVSKATRDFHVEQGLDPHRVEVLYNGVDCQRFQPRPRDGRLRRELRLPDDAMIAVTIGQIGLRKGLDVLVEAAALNAESMPHLHYVVIGERYSSKPESVAFEERLHIRVQETGLANRFHWLGYRDDVPELLNECDLLIHPARQEPLGRVLLEASASGIPVIATDVGGTREIVQHRFSGLRIPAGDPPQLATTIQELADDRAFRQQLGNFASVWMKKYFNSHRRSTELFHVWATANSQER